MIDVDVVETPIGPCTVGVRGGRLCRIRLGEGEVDGARRRLPEARRWVADWFEGRRSEAPLDLTGVPPFNLKVYDVIRTIPPGRTLTYGEVARRTGHPGAARAVGTALARNPLPLFIPCHRVVAAGGLGGWSGPGGLAQKRALLERERSGA